MLPNSPNAAGDMKNARFISRAAFFAALGLILPVFFHLFGLGSTFLPMFLPILAGSLLLSCSVTCLSRRFHGWISGHSGAERVGAVDSSGGVDSRRSWATGPASACG